MAPHNRKRLEVVAIGQWFPKCGARGRPGQTATVSGTSLTLSTMFLSSFVVTLKAICPF